MRGHRLRGAHGWLCAALHETARHAPRPAELARSKGAQAHRGSPLAVRARDVSDRGMLSRAVRGAILIASSASALNLGGVSRRAALHAAAAGLLTASPHLPAAAANLAAPVSVGETKVIGQVVECRIGLAVPSTRHAVRARRCECCGAHAPERCCRCCMCTCMCANTGRFQRVASCSRTSSESSASRTPRSRASSCTVIAFHDRPPVPLCPLRARA